MVFLIHFAPLQMTGHQMENQQHKGVLKAKKKKTNNKQGRAMTRPFRFGVNLTPLYLSATAASIGTVAHLMAIVRRQCS